LPDESQEPAEGTPAAWPMGHRGVVASWHRGIAGHEMRHGWLDQRAASGPGLNFAAMQRNVKRLVISTGRLFLPCRFQQTFCVEETLVVSTFHEADPTTP
jgi:hypothetical protein